MSNLNLSRITSTRSQRSANELSHAKTRDPLSGHLGHLSDAQQHALEKFKAICEKEKLYTPEHDGKQASHDDSTLLRFLRARRFDPVGALGQFKDTEQWRKSTQIDTLYEHFDIKSYEDARTVYPQWTGRRDRRGIPLYVYVIRHLNSKNMEAYAKESSAKATSASHKSSKISPKLLRLFALYENMLQFVLPLCSFLDRPNPESQIVSTTNIVDISGVGLKQFWNLKGHMQEASTLATAHYPETLDRIFIIGAPAFFPTVWGWIKKWFDPVTTSKIFILSQHEVQSTLSSYIDPDNIPKKYGGNMDWDFGTLPHLDQPAVSILGERFKDERAWIPGPIKWEHDGCFAVGSQNGEDRREMVTSRPIDILEEAKGAEQMKPEGVVKDTVGKGEESNMEELARVETSKYKAARDQADRDDVIIDTALINDARDEEPGEASSSNEEQNRTSISEEDVQEDGTVREDAAQKDDVESKPENKEVLVGQKPLERPGLVERFETAREVISHDSATEGDETGEVKEVEDANANGLVQKSPGVEKVGGEGGDGRLSYLHNGLMNNVQSVVNGSIHKEGFQGVNGNT